MFLKISINFYTGNFKKPYKIFIGFSYFLVLVITKMITIFEN